MLEIPWKLYKKELKKIEELEDKEEQEKRLELIDQIQNQIHLYYAHVDSYEYDAYRQKLKDKGIEFKTKAAAGMKTLWNKTFAAEITPEDRKLVHFNKYRWHIFSYGLVEALEGKEARKAFNECVKKQVYMFFQDGKEAYVIGNPDLLKAKYFDRDEDIYIFDPEEKWTYVRTHEAELGPYFYRIVEGSGLTVQEILQKFVESGWDLIAEPSLAWLEGADNREALLEAVKQADAECGSCGCEYDPLYKEFLERF